ncbi:hypothetical protein EYF80_007979 [Liparis tanakae]|uniref:Uncharacterized protein n=1 Tax=Liparis tanakae TaxID=230148 RepID=A0A4Z2IV44_9TELE|nr:hypothetical protein EYF80_007979 [Liparis tanakae]
MGSRSCFHSFSCHSIGYRNRDMRRISEQKNRWQLFVFVGDAALKVPTSPKHRIQNLQDFLLNKKPTPEKVLLLLHKTNTGKG